MGRRQDFFRRLFNRRVTRFTPGGGNSRSGLGFFGALMSTPQETKLRRIALAAALAATLAGGAAALAATPDAATPDAAPPDPYQGAWALAIDGQYAGPIAQVQGCGLAATIISESADHGKHLGAPAPGACTFQAGAGMTPGFYNLVNDGLAGAQTLHEIELIRADPAGRYGLLVSHATLRSVALPKIDRAATAPVFLEVAIAGERIVRDPSPRVAAGKVAASGFDPSRLKLSVNGQDVRASAAGPWSADIKLADDAVGSTRESQIAPAAVDSGNLGLRVPESSLAMTRTMDPWVHAALVDGKPDAEQPVKLTLGGLTLTLDHAAPQRADLVPRADGARTYSLYAEHAVIAAG